MNFKSPDLRRTTLAAAAFLVLSGGYAHAGARLDGGPARMPPDAQSVLNVQGQTIVYGTSYQSDTSLPLYYLPEWKGKVSAESSDEREAALNWHVPGHHVNGKDPVVQSFATSAPGLAMPATVLNFDGMGVGSCGCAPPDTDGEVGKTQYVQMTNAGYQVFDKASGASVLGARATSSIWAGFGGVCETSGHGDPIVLYDQIADRWVITQFAGGSTITDECIAVSTTSDATGAYKRYGYHLGSEFYDYPHLGVWIDGYYMAMNVFNTAGTAYLRPQPFAFDRAAMVAGATSAAYVTTTTLTSNDAPLLPADIDGSTLPALGTSEVFVEYPDNNTYRTYRFHADYVTPANTSFTLAGSPAAAAFTQPCGSTSACVPTKGGAANYLNALDDRLMFRLAYRKFSDHESLVGNYSVKANNVSGIRWFELRNVTSGSPSVYQESTYQPDTTWRWMGSAAMDQQGNLAIGYSASNSTINPQIRYAGRLVGDALNTLTQAEAHLFDGGGSQTGSGNRWGDYSDLTVDPVDDCTFWYTQEYYSANGSFSWKTRIGSFKFAGCGGGNVAPVANFSSTTSGLVANFTDSSTDSDGTIASRAWTFGDGGTSTATNPSHTYAAAGTYSVSLQVTDNGGLTNTKTASVTVSAANVAPVANFGSTTNGLVANFTDSSTDSDGTITARAWTFGDGGTSTATNPSHTYAAAGTYSVSLQVTDNGGLTNTKTASVTVSAANVAPVANFSFTTSALVATFTDSSTDSDGTIASRAWNFGDSGTSTATNPSHTYAAAGTYSVTLTVTDNGGLTNAKTSSVTVSSGGSNVLTNGVPVTGLSAATGVDKVYTLVVPAGATGLKFVTSGGTGDADLYAKFGSAPTTTVNDCRSEGSTTAETCSIASAQAGTYYVLVHAYATYSGVSLTGSYSTGGGGTVLTNGVPVTGLSATTGTNTAVYTLVVPAGKTSLTFKTAGSNGDADLYVRLGSAPGTTAGTYDCRPYTSSSTETCTFSSPTAGTYYVMVRAYASFTGLSLTGTYTP